VQTNTATFLDSSIATEAGTASENKLTRMLRLVRHSISRRYVSCGAAPAKAPPQNMATACGRAPPGGCSTQQPSTSSQSVRPPDSVRCTAWPAMSFSRLPNPGEAVLLWTTGGPDSLGERPSMRARHDTALLRAGVGSLTCRPAATRTRVSDGYRWTAASLTQEPWQDDRFL